MPCTFDVRRLSLVAAACLATLFAIPASATPALTMDVATGDVLYAQDATRAWFPASTTKLMTVYVALSAVRDHQIAMNTPLVISARAHAEPPSKMGFPVGTQVTLDNALKMLLVRSANDIAVTIAEGIGGSVEGFADDMNQASTKLGLRESHWVNPNGLPDSDHYSSARDMALIARALYTEFPDQAQLFNLGALSLGREIIGNHNTLLGRYPGVDGMKTGFTCSAGFNIVASAFRNGRRVVVVVFGAPTVKSRSAKVAALLDRSFAGLDRPGGPVQALPSANDGPPPDMRNQVCHNRAPLIAQFNAEAQNLDAPLAAPTSGVGLSALNPERALLFSTTPSTSPVEPMAAKINTVPQPVFDPVPVHIGAEPGYTGVVAQARMPHTAVGSEPQPVAAIAYSAAQAEPLQGVAGTPIAVDANALPMRGRKVRSARSKHGGRPAMKAAAETPKTKVLAGAEAATGDAGPAVKKATAKKAKSAKAPAAKTTTTARAPAAKAPARTAARPTKASSKPKASAAKGGAKLKSASGQ